MRRRRTIARGGGCWREIHKRMRLSLAPPQASYAAGLSFGPSVRPWPWRHSSQSGCASLRDFIPAAYCCPRRTFDRPVTPCPTRPVPHVARQRVSEPPVPVFVDGPDVDLHGRRRWPISLFTHENPAGCEVDGLALVVLHPAFLCLLIGSAKVRPARGAAGEASAARAGGFRDAYSPCSIVLGGRGSAAMASSACEPWRVAAACRAAAAAGLHGHNIAAAAILMR